MRQSQRTLMSAHPRWHIVTHSKHGTITPRPCPLKITQHSRPNTKVARARDLTRHMLARQCSTMHKGPEAVARLARWFRMHREEHMRRLPCRIFVRAKLWDKLGRGEKVPSSIPFNHHSDAATGRCCRMAGQQRCYKNGWLHCTSNNHNRRTPLHSCDWLSISRSSRCKDTQSTKSSSTN